VSDERLVEILRAWWDKQGWIDSPGHMEMLRQVRDEERERCTAELKATQQARDTAYARIKLLEALRAEDASSSSRLLERLIDAGDQMAEDWVPRGDRTREEWESLKDAVT
jgi:hypothetical protein